MDACGSSNASLPMRFDAPDFLTPARYGGASETAHAVLGVALAVIVVVWGALVVLGRRGDGGRVSLVSCYACAGGTSLGAGCYLLAWVYWLSAPRGADLAVVRAFANRDLVQQQHASISCCLAVAGLAEILHARAAAARADGACLLGRDWVHSVWFGCVATVGLIFVGHPQRASGAVAAHVAIGVSLLAGGFLLAVEKRARFESRSLDAPAAGVAVSVAAVILVAYAEPEERGNVHRGVEKHCMPGWPLALLGFAYSAAAAAALAAAALLDAASGRRPPEKDRGEYELARRADWPLPAA